MSLYKNKDVLDEIDKYYEERGFSERLRDLAKTRFIQAQHEYNDTWQTWSVERHNKEALEELADYINYQVFIRLLERAGDPNAGQMAGTTTNTPERSADPHPLQDDNGAAEKINSTEDSVLGVQDDSGAGYMEAEFLSDEIDEYGNL